MHADATAMRPSDEASRPRAHDDHGPTLLQVIDRGKVGFVDRVPVVNRRPGLGIRLVHIYSRRGERPPERADVALSPDERVPDILP